MTIIFYSVIRSRGRFSQVEVHWRIYNSTTLKPVEENKDFTEVSGHIVMLDQQEKGTISIIPAADGVPEFAEEFHVKIVNVTGKINLNNKNIVYLIHM